MAFNYHTPNDPVVVPIRPLLGMQQDIASNMLKIGNFLTLSNYYVTRKGIQKRHGYIPFAGSMAIPVLDQPIIALAPVWKTTGVQFATLLTSRFLFALSALSSPVPVYWVYNTGLCSNDGVTITGYGTDWNAAANYIQAGDYIVFGIAEVEEFTDGDCEAATSPTLTGSVLVYPGNTWERSAVQVHSGTYSWCLTVTEQYEFGVILHSPLSLIAHGFTLGQSYSLSVWMYTDAVVPSNARFEISEYDVYHNTLAVHTQTVSTASVWEEVTDTITFSPEMHSVTFRLVIDATEAVGTVLYIDDISLIATVTTPVRIDSIVDQNTITLESEPDIAAVTEYMEYGDCENANSPTLDAGSTGLTNGTWARSIAQFKSGLSSWVLTKTSAVGAGEASVNLADNETTTDMHGLTAGDTYLFSLWAYTDAAVLANTTIKFQEYHTAAWNDSIEFSCAAASTWENFSESITLNASTTGIRIELVIHTDEAIGTVLYIDDISLVENGNLYAIYRAFNVDDTTLLDWTVADGKLIVADHARPLYAYDGTTFTIYDSDVTYIPACVTFFSDRLWIANTIEDGVYYYQRLRWSSPTDRTSFDPGDYIDLPYTAGPIKRIVPLGRFLAVYFQDTIFVGVPSNLAYLPYAFKQFETGSKGLIGARAVTTVMGGHFFVGQDDVYYFSGQELKALNCPVVEAMILSCQDRRRIYAINDVSNNRILFGMPETGKYIEKMWSYSYKTQQWSYDNVTATSLSSPALDLGLSWDDLATYLSVNTWDEGMLTFESWDSIGSIIASNKVYKSESGLLTQLSDNSGSDDGTAYTTTFETSDMDFNELDKDKSFFQFRLKLAERPEVALNFYITYSLDGGYTWTDCGILTVPITARESKVDFIATGSAIRFKVTETSTALPYTVTELSLRLCTKGDEVELD
jgi:hypothetical protein